MTGKKAREYFNIFGTEPSNVQKINKNKVFMLGECVLNVEASVELL